MKTGILCAAALIAVPFMAGSAIAADPEAQQASDKDMPEAQVTEETTKAEEKKICRRITEGTGSRKKVKVCLTRAEWKAFNSNQRR